MQERIGGSLRPLGRVDSADCWSAWCVQENRLRADRSGQLGHLRVGNRYYSTQADIDALSRQSLQASSESIRTERSRGKAASCSFQEPPTAEAYLQDQFSRTSIKEVNVSLAVQSLPAQDLASFARLGINEKLLTQAHVRRVSDREAEEVFGFKYSGDKSGIAFPYYIGDRRVTARLRRDNPEVDLEGRTQNKYISAWGDQRHLYFPPGFVDAVRADSEVAIVAVEAEKSALAGTAWAQRTGARLAFFAMGGCWGWRGRISKTESADGTRVDVKGALPDLAICDGRKIYILLDSNVAAQPKVRTAERALVVELRNRKCDVLTCRLPILHGVNGPDDLVAVAGDDALAEVIAKAQDPEAPDTVDGIPVHAEEIMALRLAEIHSGTLRYTEQWKQWNVYDGRSWVPDKKLGVFTMVRHLCHEVASGIGNPMVAKSTVSGKTIAAVEKLARTVEPHPAVAEQWDANPWLLNTPGGVINLKLGEEGAFELRPSRPEDYSIKMTAAVPGGHCPLFLKFLSENTGGDKEFEAHLQMVLGYCITGCTEEQVLFDIFGPPGTGKTTLVEVIANVMGTYAISAPIETFTESKYDRHPTELARLEGARLVTTTETADGHFLAESRVNSITGGEPITARALFRDFTTYTPTFKLIIVGNYRPRLKNPKGGIQRRLRLLPLTAIVPVRDPKLPEKLKAEYGGILQWQIEGCRRWQEARGLEPPKMVSLATSEYFASEDGVGRWIEERARTDIRSDWEPSKNLYADYTEWGEQGKEFSYSQKRFGQELESRGFRRQTSGAAGTKGYLGIKLRYPRSR